MLYRRRVLLSTIEVFQEKLTAIELQKILFLIAKKQEKSSYDFVPYKYGCYSFSMKADLDAMERKKIIALGKVGNYIKLDTKYFASLKPEDKIVLKDIRDRIATFNTNELIKYTYKQYPYYAINSVKAHEILSRKEYAKVQSSRVKREDSVLFTIGYEGISLEEYLNRLLQNDIKLLVDVRNNPFSMKFGFSKNLLKRFCINLGIEYIHFKEVGIQSTHRKSINTQADYDELFETYRNYALKETVKTQEKILDLLVQHKRIALICFEACISQCHRKHLAEKIATLDKWQYSIVHL